MADYADLAAARDAQVDVRLGDSINYSQAGGPYLPMKAFLIFDDPVEGYVNRDTAKGVVRLKIRKAALVGEPSMADRITAPLLGTDVHRPLGPKTDPIDPLYWRVDLQRV